MRVALLSALLAAWLLSSLPSTAGVPPGCGVVPAGCETWSSIYIGTDDWSPNVLASPDGSRAFLITRDWSSGEQAIAIHAHDSQTGETLWKSTNAPLKFPNIRMAAASPDGSRIHLVGHGASPDANAWQAFVLTYNTRDGTFLWLTKWDLDTEGHALVASPDGLHVYATGVQAGHNYITTALDAATGQKIWTASFDNRGGHSGDWRGFSSDIPYGIATDGPHAYVIGTSAAANGLLEATIIAYDAPTGTHLWTRRAHSTDSAGTPLPTEGYEVSATGKAVYALGTHGLEAYDPSSGARLWSQAALACRPYWAMHSPGDCVLEASPDNERVYLATHHAVAAFRATDGEEIWRLPLRAGVARLPLDAGDHRLGMTGDMTMAPDGSRLYVATPGGRDRYVTDTASGLNANIETLALDASSGQLLWRTVYDRAWETVSSMDATSTRVLVSGETARTRPTDAVLLAYDASLGLASKPPTR